MIDSVYNAHINIIEKINKTKEASTTILIAFDVKFVYVSVRGI